MAEAATAGSQALQRILETIAELGLNNHLIDLETQGYTTIRGVLSTQTVKHAREAILARVERNTGTHIDLDTATEEDFEGMTYLPYLLYDNQVFEEILMEPKPLALITYLLGESCVLSSLGCHFKGPGGTPLPLHSDNGNGMPAPFPPISQIANVNYALTPYSEEAGALALVPGSHKLARQPRTEEMMLGGDNTNLKAIAMDLSPGDVVVWHGNTWHGSFARQIPGIRVNLAVYFARQYIQTQEHHAGEIAPDVLARHDGDERFKVLLGAKQPYGWKLDGPDYELMARNPRGLYD
jgi:ectoine hydroxylase-related dioxygenase (phytanoyl-CoA dioxygenase family)